MALILVVDDESDMRLATSRVLKKQGHQIVEAGDGETALQELGRQPVELVLLDIRLPGMDGLQALKKIRQTRKDLPVVMATGYGSVDTAVRVMEAGANGYLSKPFSNAQLIETVERVLEVRRLSRESSPLYTDLVRKLSESPPPAAKKAVAPPPRQNRRRAWPWLAAAGLLAAGALWMFGPWSRLKQHPVPFSNPTAIAWNDGKLWVADWVTQTVYQLQPEGPSLRVLGTTVVPEAHLTGLVVVHDFVYTCDSWRKVIQKRRADPALTLVKEVPSPGPTPSGLFFDGQYLWSCDMTRGKIFQHALNDRLTVIATYPSPGKAPVALAKDPDYFWSADAETRKLYRHRLDDRLTVLSEIQLDELNRGREPLSAVALHENVWWLGRDGKNVLYTYPMKSRAMSPGPRSPAPKS
jgi:CheY-like chemotaxis protein